MKRVRTKHFFLIFSVNWPKLRPLMTCFRTKKKKKITPQNLNIYIQFFIYLITFLAFVTIREKKNESKRFWFRVTISFRIALKKFFFFGLFKNCTAEFQMSWYLLLRRRSPPEVQQWRISHFKLGWKLDEMAKKEKKKESITVCTKDWSAFLFLFYSTLLFFIYT